MRASFNARVRMTVSTHIASAGGKSASCTMGPEFAVKRLADKLWGEGKHVCTPIQGTIDAQLWLIQQEQAK